MHMTPIIRAKVSADSFGQLVHVDADPTTSNGSPLPSTI